MFTAPRRLIWLALISVVAFGIGLTQLFLLRFEAGDVYPPYSSLRSDPLGIRALFESLNAVAAGSAQRNFRPVDQMQLNPDTIVLICGLPANAWQLRGKRWERLMDQLAAEGGQIVVTFTPSAKRRAAKNAHTADDADETQQDGNQTSTQEEDNASENSGDEVIHWLGLQDLGIALERADQARHGDNALRVPDDWAQHLPSAIAWHGAVYFELQDHAWQTIYAWDAAPVVVKRPWGRGTLVMAADSYLFSNEALRDDRLPDLLAWFMVPGHAVIFDEFHHGLVKQPGIVGLARKYGLQGLFAVLVLLALLFVWQQSAVFVPRLATQPQDDVDQAAAGRDTSEGLINLMQQHIRSADLLTVCFDTWHASAAAGQVSAERIAQAKRLVQANTGSAAIHDPVKVYQQICELLQQGKRL